MRSQITSNGHLLALLALLSLAVQSSTIIAQEVLADRIVNFKTFDQRLSTSGKLRSGALPLLQQQGFKTILDLRTPKEGTAQEQRDAEALGLSYINIPVSRSLPSQQTLAKIRNLLDNSDAPILMHCGSGSRVGMVWSLLRLQAGDSLKDALDQGRKMGMNSTMEAKVLEKTQID
ncbi:hypothetical protein HBA55_09470 [Pseudomaricurvus alkylphenolicus]|jgi:uncharacterized protein (TIGR01244 family)|uniref:beta-lactamase hydrolase domain-containing protein n=1 Tax=Pseudomaricurvus alkylphenolicus TaxID=1306991 RepID=UPI00142196AE|nr:sulfur transferase domain-containing protein [Pseudomaricurvus alkylphenolicus]NIB39813.1 hypothetical protein [Pseudomaricurvus alkylphenolicus]